MDDQLKEIVSLASARGSKYMKGETTITGIPEKMTELGIYLLVKSPRIQDSDSDRLREELNDVQQKIDDLRKAIFTNKLKKSS